jgi:hypothetical protein
VPGRYGTTKNREKNHGDYDDLTREIMILRWKMMILLEGILPSGKLT